LTGSLVFDKDITDMSVIELNTSEIKSGYYVMTLVSDQQVVSCKLIK